MTDRLALPIDAVLPELLERLAARGVVVLEAPPGAGKTTRVPAALLAERSPNAGVEGQVLVLEPRRIAARASARRVAEELDARVGGLVGYDVRHDRAIGPDTRLAYLTEGIVLRRLLEDPELRGVGAVVLDEFHERHLQADLALALLCRLRARKRPDLRLVVMSATLDSPALATFLDAPIVRSEGRRFPVEIAHAEAPDDRPLPQQVAGALRSVLRGGIDGDVLVFLPGAGEIRKCEEASRALAAEFGVELLPLHGELSPAAQDRAIAPGKPGDRRRVILSTNVAETSVTLPDVVVVIDSGLARVASHDAWSGRSVLEVRKISRASATQRAGRAGRVRAGRAIRLYTKGDHDARPAHDAPEIERLELSETLLTLAALGVDDARALEWLTAPPEGAVAGATALLERLDAIERGSLRLTELGRRMARFPLPPRAARALVEAERRGAPRDGALLAALLAEGRALGGRGHRDGDSDLLADLEDFVACLDERGSFDADRARRMGLDVGAASAIDRTRRTLERTVDRRASPAADPDTALRIATLAAHPDRVGKRRSDDPAGRLGAARTIAFASGGTGMLDESSVVKTAPYLVAVEAGERREAGAGIGGGRTRITVASAIEPDWLIDLFADRVQESVDVRWNEASGRVEAMARMTYDRLVLDERPAGREADADAAALLAKIALEKGLGAFLSEADATWIESLPLRVAAIAADAPELLPELPVVEGDALARLLADATLGRRRLDELADAHLADALRAEIGHAALTKLDELAPTHVVLGNGRRARVDYVRGQTPSISSRLQDFFGSADTPRIGRGRIALVLHLLAPNGRDVQVTRDLAGFWTKHYPGIRSELMRRYPRHSWPEDGRNATPPEPRPRRNERG